MRRALVLLLAAMSSAFSVHAAEALHVRFEADAFNRAVPASARGNAVFSPYAFEIGCVALSDAFGPIVKAQFAERLSVLTDLEQTYNPIVSRFRNFSATNGFSVLMARALCLPDRRMAQSSYRSEIQRLYATEVCQAKPKDGVESWFRAMLDGEMEDFALGDAPPQQNAYSYHEAVSVRFSWKEPFPTANTKDIAFHLADGGQRAVSAMRDLRMADIWEAKRFSMLRLPLADGGWFFALLPAEGLSVGDIRSEFNSAKVDDLLTVMDSVTVTGVSHGPAAVVIPKMDITTEVGLSDAFAYFRFPLKGFARMNPELRPATVSQRMRFRLDEQGLDPEPLVSKAEESQVRASADTKKFVLNRPFLFFVFHMPTGTIPVAGQFTGR